MFEMRQLNLLGALKNYGSMIGSWIFFGLSRRKKPGDQPVLRSQFHPDGGGELCGGVSNASIFM